MNRRYWLAGSIIAGLGVIGFSIYYYFKRQSEMIKNFTYRILDVKILQFTPQNISGNIRIEFGNTSDIEVEVDSFYVDFFVNDQYVGFLDDSSQFVILPNAKTPVSFNFFINPQDVIGNIVDILSISLNASNIIFRLEGNANIKSGYIKVSVPVDFESTLKEMLM